ncbi:hypothetical protein A9X00_01875 [Mycobacterium sp. 1245805.9]|nr:hypothetical protein A9X00_01875 [Mycobacterium sp. 1245805.9]
MLVECVTVRDLDGHLLLLLFAPPLKRVARRTRRRRVLFERVVVDGLGLGVQRSTTISRKGVTNTGYGRGDFRRHLLIERE